MSSRGATLTGLGAIALWSLLALFTAATGKVPPFQLAAMTFAVGGAFGIAGRGGARAARSGTPEPGPGSRSGSTGCSAITALYFAALKFAPPAEANLVHYLWPLLIVLFAALLPGGRLAPRHLAGAAIGLAATALLVGGRFGGAGANAPLGFACALLGAFVWAGYSVLRGASASVPTDAVAVLLPRRERACPRSAISPSRRRSGRRARANGSRCSGSGSGRSGRRSTCGTSA